MDICELEVGKTPTVLFPVLDKPTHLQMSTHEKGFEELR